MSSSMADGTGVGRNLSEETVKKACELAFKAHSVNQEFTVDKVSHSSVTFFAFSGKWSAEEWFKTTAGAGESVGAFGESKIKLSEFPCLRSISNNELAKVNLAFLTRSRSRSLREEVEKALDANRTIIFTGHSSGGPVAIFATIWLFEKLRKLEIQPSSTSHNCITFGSPLSADRIFCHAVRREDWSDHFVHFVMRYDTVPRIPLAPPSSTVGELPAILSFFQRKTQSPTENNSSFDTSKLASEFFVNVTRNTSCAATHAACTLMGSTNMLMDTISGFIELSPYRPFGTFVFCSGNGRQLVVKNPDAVLQLLFYCLQLSSEAEGPEIAKASLRTHFDYFAHINQGVSNRLCLDEFGEIPLNSDTRDSEIRAIDEVLNDFGLSTRARLCLRAARESEKQKRLNQSKIEDKTKLMDEAMTNLENYRSSCHTRGGYYDSFRQNQETADFQANVKRLELAGIWDEIVEMLKRYELPEEFEGKKYWVDLGTKFRRLVEPLDIANYYRHLKNEDTGSYLERGRPRRYRYTQRWLEHSEQNPDGTRGESAFWAEVEELRIKIAGGRLSSDDRNKAEEIRKKLENWLEVEKTVEKDAFFKDSSVFKLYQEVGLPLPTQ